MEKLDIKLSKENESTPQELGKEFNERAFSDFIDYLYDIKESNPLIRITIIADWVNLQKTRSAKALLDQYKDRLDIESITIRATKEQYKEDVNTFQSGLKWEEV